MSMDYRTYLEHYGVLGMHWGVRKDKDRISRGNALYRAQMDRKMEKAQARVAKKLEKSAKKTAKKEIKDTKKADGVYIRAEKQKLVDELEAKYNKELSVIRKHLEDIYNTDNDDVSSQYYKAMPKKDIDLKDIDVSINGVLNQAGRDKVALIDRKCVELTQKIRTDYPDDGPKSPNGFYSLKINKVEADPDHGTWIAPTVSIYDETKKRNTIFMSGTEEEVEEFLAHYGVLGMHWGVRKDKNGIRRGKPSKRVASDDYNNTRELKRKRLYELSNAELQAMNQRRQLEENYKKLNPNFVRTGTTATTKLLREIGKEVAKDAIKDYLKPSSAQMSIWNL